MLWLNYLAPYLIKLIRGLFQRLQKKFLTGGSTRGFTGGAGTQSGDFWRLASHIPKEWRLFSLETKNLFSILLRKIYKIIAMLFSLHSSCKIISQTSFVYIRDCHMCAIIVDQSLQRKLDLSTLWRLLEVSGALARAFWSFLEALERSLEDSRAFWSFLEVSGGAGTGPKFHLIS